MLAQEWLFGNRVETEYDKWVEKHLALPTRYNPHSSLAILNNLAERIVFTDDVPSMLYEMHDNKQLTYKGVLSSAKLPYDTFWLEYQTRVGMDADDEIENVMHGALIQRISGEGVRMFIITALKPRDYPLASTLTHIIEFDQWPPLVIKEHEGVDKSHIKFAIRYAFNEGKLRNSPDALKATGEVGSIVCEMIFGIFLVTQPKVYESEHIVWSDRKQGQRKRANKPPLLEYRRIRVHVVKPSKHYGHRPRPAALIQGIADTESDAAITHRRYHKVMGHFRHYINHDPPHTTWIEPHYRGDPKLGITFTERDVMR